MFRNSACFVAAALSLSLALTPASRAALPPAAEGKELPSLAPMLERVTPAVVNIATVAACRLGKTLCLPIRSFAGSSMCRSNRWNAKPKAWAQA